MAAIGAFLTACLQDSMAPLPKPVGQSSNAHEAVVHTNAVAGTNTLSTLAHLVASDGRVTALPHLFQHLGSVVDTLNPKTSKYY